MADFGVIDLGVVGTGIALAPLTKPLYIAQVSAMMPGVNAQGALATVSTLGGSLIAYFGRNNELIRYLGEGVIGYGIGLALDAPYNATPTNNQKNVNGQQTINRNIVPPRRNAEPARVGLKGASILI